MKPRLWLVVADASAANIYAVSSGKDADLVAGLAHPEGRLRARDLMADRPGQTAADARGGGPSAYAAKTPPAAAEEDRFARTLADALEHGHATNRFTELALVMPPKLLGLVRGHLRAPTRGSVVAELGRRLVDVPVADVVREVDARRPRPELV